MGNGDLKGKTIVRRCPACGKVTEMPLTTYYCSAECGQKMKKRNMKDRPKIVFSKCRVCGDWFYQGIGHHKTTCSEECKKKSFHPTRDTPMSKRRCRDKEFEKTIDNQVFCSHSKPNELDKIAHKAREEHISYGEWVASHEYGAHVDKRW